jgi:hypothetical protein
VDYASFSQETEKDGVSGALIDRRQSGKAFSKVLHKQLLTISPTFGMSSSVFIFWDFLPM